MTESEKNDKKVVRNRPSTYKKKKRVNKVIYVRLTDAHFDKLDVLADIAGKSKSAIARLFIEQGIMKTLKAQKEQSAESEQEDTQEGVKTLDNL